MTSTLLHSYAPQGAARLLFGERGPEVLMSGPAGTGKTRACLEKLHLMCLKNPGMRGLVVRKTLASLGSTALQTYRAHVASEAFSAGIVEFYGGSSEEPPQYRYENGSVLVIGGMDKPSRIMSSDYDAVYAQEAIELTVDDWEALTTRLRNGRVSFQQMMADTNPSYPTHWLKKRCDDGFTRILNSRHEDNPVLFDRDGNRTKAGAAYIDKLDRLTGVRMLRLRLGQWVAAEGIVYDDYEPAVHLVDRFEVPDEWARYWAVDFGFTNPFVCQMWAEDPDGVLWMYREHYMSHRTYDEHAREILKSVTNDAGEWVEPRPTALVADHDGEGRAQLERHLGMRVTKAKKAVSEGIQLVQQRLKTRRLHIMRDSLVERDPALVEASLPTCTEEEIGGYVWDLGGGRKPKEQPVKENDHGMDTKRYVVAHRDMGATPNIRGFTW